MRWLNAVSEDEDFDRAYDACCSELDASLAGEAPHLLLVFVTPIFRSVWERLYAHLDRRFPSALILGCSGAGVVGSGRELEGGAGLSITAAILPETRISPFYFDPDERPFPDVDHLEAFVGVEASENPAFILLFDPFHADLETWVRNLDWVYPRSPKIGGLASGAQVPGLNALFTPGGVRHKGLIGVALSGGLRMETVVAQGCRPIGEPMFVTACRENVLRELNRMPAGEVVTKLYHELSTADQALFRESLFLGLEMRPLATSHQRGDYLIRNVLGIDPRQGALLIGAKLEETGVVQFHLRDGDTSRLDLEQQFEKYLCEKKGGSPSGALMFACLGRGRRLYGEPDFDSGQYAQRFPGVPMAGLFCNGEIGPVQGQTFIHGYTSCFGLFYEAE